MNIYYVEVTQVPMCYVVARHYERTWIHGYDGTYNINPISPGLYFYTIWKEWYTPVPASSKQVSITLVYEVFFLKTNSRILRPENPRKAISSSYRKA